MGKYIAENTVKSLIQTDSSVKNANVAILGFTFKENCQDTRNTKVFDIVEELRSYGIEPVVADPIADVAEAKKLYNIDIVDMMELQKQHAMDAVIITVAHDCLKDLGIGDIGSLYAPGKTKVMIDVKGILEKSEYQQAGYLYWRL